MKLVLSNALVPAAVAPEIVRRLPGAAPTLAAWLAAAQPTQVSVPVADVGCTPDEAWQLQEAGYRPPAEALLGSGWPLLDNTVTEPDPDAAIWLADLVHLRVAQQGVTLLDPAMLALSATEAQALLDTAIPLLAEIGIGLTPLTCGRVRVHLPADVAPYAPTPTAVGGTDIQDLWRQGAGARPWRRALNIAQMAWHDHPVNQAREAGGHLPVNGLWLFGGGRRVDLGAPAPAAQIVIDDTLTPAARAGDWASWLTALTRLDAERLAPLEAAGARRSPDGLCLILAGDERLATLDLSPPRGLRRWLPTRRHDWQRWWLAPA